MINQRGEGLSEITQLSSGRSGIQTFVPSTTLLPCAVAPILTHQSGPRELMHASLDPSEFTRSPWALVKNPPAMQETPVQFLGGGDPWRRSHVMGNAGLWNPWGTW